MAKLRVLPAGVLAASLLLPAPSVVAQDADSAFEATGEIRFRVSGGITSGASFSSSRVVGPVVNMTRREDGTWAGDLLGENLDLHAEDARADRNEQKMAGSGFTLVQRPVKDGVEIEGQYKGLRFRVEVKAKRVKGRFGNCSLDLDRKGTVYRGDLGCLIQGAALPETGRAVLELMGDAQDRAPFPQLGIALMAVLPS
jgi:hypothetical protein